MIALNFTLRVLNFETFQWTVRAQHFRPVSLSNVALEDTQILQRLEGFFMAILSEVITQWRVSERHVLQFESL